MKLAMILGKKQGDAIKPRLQNIKDNLDIDVFDDIPEFVYNVSKRNTIYDRILVLSTKITTNALRDLNTCWGMYSKETAVVMLSRKGQDEEKAKQFLEVFKTPVACAMMVSSTTVQIIAESVLRPTGELNNDYGFKEFLAVELDEDEFIPEPPPQPAKPVQQKPQQPTQPKQQAQQNSGKPVKKKKGGGLFGGIFGSRGPIDDEPESEPETVQESEPVQPPMPPVAEPVRQQVQPEEHVDDWGSSFEGDSWEQTDAEEDDFGGDFGSMPVADEEPLPEAPRPMRAAQAQQTAQAQQKQQRQPMQRQQSPIQQRRPQQSPQQNFNAPTESASGVVDESFEATFVEDSHTDDDFTPEGVTADVDFGEGGTFGSHEPAAPARRVQQSVEQADENLGDVSVIDAEAQYRAQKEAPKVITRVVREPILGSGSALKGVYAGRLRKVVIVTGDRGTGVTSTALNIAQTLAKKVDVLYFDCDIANHGLLNYIDYSNFKNYEEINMEGVKVCRSEQVFSRCVINWDDNLSFLTSDFSCDCTDEELRETAQVVAEVANNYGVVVVDCPVDKLTCIEDLILTGQAVICAEGSKRGFMNMLCRLEASPLHVRYKRNLVSRGIMFITKCNPKMDLKRLLAYIKAIYQPDGVDWLSIKPVPFNGKLSETLLNSILEG